GAKGCWPLGARHRLPSFRTPGVRGCPSTATRRMIPTTSTHWPLRSSRLVREASHGRSTTDALRCRSGRVLWMSKRSPAPEPPASVEELRDLLVAVARGEAPIMLGPKARVALGRILDLQGSPLLLSITRLAEALEVNPSTLT